MKSISSPTFFKTSADFRKWLEKYHTKATELIVGFYKIGSGKPSMTWSESVDQAICFGWIDGVRRSIDKHSYCIRFTPRKKDSIWSAINIAKVKELTKKGQMHNSGLNIFSFRQEHKSKIYPFEKAEVKLSPDFEMQFRKNKPAWSYFQSLASSYRKYSTHWVMSAKQQSTKIKRLNELIKDSAARTNKWKDNKYAKKPDKEF